MAGLLRHLFAVRDTRASKQVGDRHMELLQAVDSARREWIAAESYFKMVSEPELVDHAVFMIEAARKRYEYLLRVAREQKINAYPS